MLSAEKRTQLFIFLTVTFIGLFFMQGNFRVWDAFPMILTAQSICEKGTLAIVNLNEKGNEQAGDWGNILTPGSTVPDKAMGIRNKEGSLYSKYGVGAPLVLAPFWLIGLLTAFLTGIEGPDRISLIVFITGFSVPIMSGICAILVFNIGRLFGYRQATCAFLSLSLTLSSSVLVYSGSFMSEVGQLVFILFAWYFLLGFMIKKKPLFWAVISGFGFGMLFLFKFTNIIYAIPLIALLASKFVKARIKARAADSGETRLRYSVEFRRELLGVIIIMLELLVFTCLFLYLNYIRWGDPLITGYNNEGQLSFQPIYKGIMGHLLSPGKSIFIYFPPAILFFFSIRRFYKAFPSEFWFFLFSILVEILFYSNFTYWSGHWSWGPRYAIPIFPAFLIPVGILIDQHYRNIYRSIFKWLCALGFLVQLPVLINQYNGYIARMANLLGGPAFDKMFFSLKYSPVVGNWWLLICRISKFIFNKELSFWDGKIETLTSMHPFFITLSRDVPALSNFFYITAAVFLSGVLLAGCGLILALRAVRVRETSRDVDKRN